MKLIHLVLTIKSVNFSFKFFVFKFKIFKKGLKVQRSSLHYYFAFNADSDEM